MLINTNKTIILGICLMIFYDQMTTLNYLLLINKKIYSHFNSCDLYK